MPDDLGDALAALRPLLLDEKALVRAVAAGRRRNERPRWDRVELRPVDLKAGRRLQIVTSGSGAPVTRNEDYGPAADQAVDELLADSFGNWHVQTTTETLQLRVTKKGAAQLHRAPNVDSQHTGHDRDKPHLIDPGDPLFTVLGAGASKRRQVDAFLRVLAAAVDDAGLPTDRPLCVVDLGCGNAYLTFAAYRYLSERGDVELVGVDLREEARDRNTAIAADLGWSDHVRFEAGSILDTTPSRLMSETIRGGTRTVLRTQGGRRGRWTSYWRCMRATPRPTTRWRRRSAGRRRWCSPRRAAITTCSASCGPRRRPRPTAC